MVCRWFPSNIYITVCFVLAANVPERAYEPSCLNMISIGVYAMSTALITTAKAALVTLFAGALAYVVYQCVFSPLAVFPGPFAAKLSKTWRAYVTYRGHWHRDLVALHRRHGSVVRIGPNELSVIDPDAFLQIYSANGAYAKSASYSIVQGSRPFDLAGERSEKIHAAQRRLVARAYSMESVMHFETQVDELIAQVLRKFDDVALSKTVIDLGYWVQLFTFDVIGAISFTKPYGFLSSGSDSLGTEESFFAKLKATFDNAAWLMHAGWFFRLHQKVIMPIVGNLLAVNERNGFFFRFAQREVQERKDRGGNDQDMVGRLLKVQQTKAELDDLSIAFMMTSNIFAGSDTTSAALRSIFLNLIRHPRVLAKLRSELQDREANGKLSLIVQGAEADACPYLQVIIYESMRLFSPVSFMLDRDVPAEGIMIRGHHVPSGTVVGTSPWAIHLSPEVWGDDVDEFRPERWLDCEDPGNLKRFFFSFGGGTRGCIGRNISWFEMEKLVSTLVMRYDFKLAEDAEITEECGTVVYLMGLRVTIARLGE
ncbi:cytochrome P450 [Xylaria bambusicola]|uniref:cytochrome P450 n=1 Tax=Xylaria bambusicola TaxID=326684 RepID=UPI0020077E6C|nr:cytochrome P450 [Xylaria bambusicola]KAI0509332.1 cytochrome P450 [Xylaria bambusicola]